MFGLSKRSTRLGSCRCAQVVEKPRQVKQIVGNQRTPLKVVKRRVACKANYQPQTIQPARMNRSRFSIVIATALPAKSSTQIGGARWRGDTSMQNIVSRNRAAIRMLIRALARSDFRALQRCADKKAFRLAVGI